MPSFDFITDKNFRQSLESDLAEMTKAVSNGQWKAAQVLAGSVVEALLIDQLIASPSVSGKDPLKLDLSEAIALCKEKKFLTGRTADLCSVVRSYRNLIHPGRMVRLGEPAPSKDSANIAMSLVELITSELSLVRAKEVGLTAEQLVSKLQRDADSLSFFKHLAQETTELQRERFLLELVPDAHASLGEFDDLTSAGRMESAFGTTFSIVTDEVKKKVAANFVRMLREADGSYVSEYAEAFFRAPHLKFVAEQHRQMVVDYLLGRLDKAMSLRTLEMCAGLNVFLGEHEAQRWADPLIRTLMQEGKAIEVKAQARLQLEDAYMGSNSAFDSAVGARLEVWRKHYAKAQSTERLKLLESVIKNMLPF